MLIDHSSARKTRTACSVLFALILPLANARAQSAAPASEPKAADADEPIVLSPFTVSTAEDEHGYQATSTLAGTRLRTDLRDIGAAISVTTKDFLNDTGITSNATLLTYTTSTEVAGVHGNYSGFGNGNGISENRLNPQSTTRVRGLDNADNTREYFLTNIPWDSYNIDRVDTVRGPNSILYGLGSPAGIVNTTLNEARFNNKTVVEARYGRFGSYRGSLDTNLVLMPHELALRLDTVYSAQQFQQEEAFNHDFRQFGALRYDPKALNVSDRMTTTIKANFEHGQITSNNPTTSPPTDYITPWFDPARGNKFTTDPFLSWTANDLGPTWTTHGIVSGVPSGNAQSAHADGSPNPYYNPWIGTPFQGGVTLLNGFGAATPKGLTFFQPKLSIGTNVSVIGLGIEGIPYNQFNGVRGYKGWAEAVQLPGYQTGLYKDKYVTDPTVFDYYNHLIGGDNSRQWQNWTSFNLSLSQTFLEARLGYEIAAHQEQYHNGQWSLFGGNGALNVITDTYNADGTVNENFGKPFVTGNGRWGNNSLDAYRDDYRLTVYGELRGSDLFAANSTAAKLFGRQRVTGLYATDNYYTQSKSWMLYATDPGYDALTQNNNQVVNLTNYAPNVVAFMGNSLANASTLSGAYLAPAQKISMPKDGTVDQFITKWTAPPSVDPNGAWTPESGAPGTLNAHNPANYQGWTNVNVHVLSAFDGDLSQLYTDGQKAETRVTSKAAIWQGFFADGTIVPLFGIRKDKVKTSYATPPRRADSTYDLADPGYQLSTPTVESGTTRTYSLVLHLPNGLKNKLPAGMDLSAFYSQSANFQPGSGRVDIYGDALADPQGKTKDYGVLLSLLDEKVIFKVNKFETSLNNATSGPIGGALWFIGSGLERDWVFEEKYRTNYGQSWQGQYSPWAGQTQAEADAIKNAAIGAFQTFWQDPDTQRIVKAWQIAQNPIGFQTDSYSGHSPNGVSATQDTISKGYEFELTTQVTKNWTLTANASKTTATVSNVGGAALSAWVKKYSQAMQGPMGDIRLWWGGSTYTARDDWNSSFYGTWSQGQIGAGSDVSELRPWHFNVVTNYRFDDHILNGVNIGGAYRWASKTVIGYPTTLDSAGEYHFDLGNAYKGPADKAFDFWIGYDFKPVRKTRWHVQLNVRNAFANRDLIPVNVQYDGGPAAFRIPDPLGWEFTSRLEF